MILYIYIYIMEKEYINQVVCEITSLFENKLMQKNIWGIIFIVC